MLDKLILTLSTFVVPDARRSLCSSKVVAVRVINFRPHIFSCYVFPLPIYRIVVPLDSFGPDPKTQDLFGRIKNPCSGLLFKYIMFSNALFFLTSHCITDVKLTSQIRRRYGWQVLLRWEKLAGKGLQILSRPMASFNHFLIITY